MMADSPKVDYQNDRDKTTAKLTDSNAEELMKSLISING